jgi:hypothetical protein
MSVLDNLRSAFEKFTHGRKVKSEADVATDPNLATSRDTGGVVNPAAPDQGSTTGTTPSGDYVGRIAGDDPGDIGESGAERRASAEPAEE